MGPCVLHAPNGTFVLPRIWLGRNVAALLWGYLDRRLCFSGSNAMALHGSMLHMRLCASVALWPHCFVATWLGSLLVLCLWLCGYIALWPGASLGIWLCGLVAMWLCGSAFLWLCGAVALWRYGPVYI
jgi:hypothetical protein